MDMVSIKLSIKSYPFEPLSERHHSTTGNSRQNIIAYILAKIGDIKAALTACDLSKAPNYSKIATKYRVNRVTLSRYHKGLQGSREEAID